MINGNDKNCKIRQMRLQCIITYHTASLGIIVTHNLATTYEPLVKTEFSNRLVSKERLLKATPLAW